MKMRKQDISHHQKLNSFVEQYGWIDPKRFGNQASQDAWLITQHMVHDEGKFQKRMLSLMKPGENISATKYALLSDRIKIIFDKKPQKYGTQGKCQSDGDWQVEPVENFELIDQRRLAIGFERFVEYEARMDFKCASRFED